MYERPWVQPPGSAPRTKKRKRKFNFSLQLIIPEEIQMMCCHVEGAKAMRNSIGSWSWKDGSVLLTAVAEDPGRKLLRKTQYESVVCKCTHTCSYTHLRAHTQNSQMFTSSIFM